MSNAIFDSKDMKRRRSQCRNEVEREKQAMLPNKTRGQS